MHRGLVAVAVGACLLGVLAPAASASQLIDRNAVGATLSVSTDGRALVTYRSGSRVRHVLAWGAVNALPPSMSRPQVSFKLDYSGGRGAWKTFKNACRAVRSVVKYEVAVCIAPDGSYWALQSWQRGLPDYGIAPTPAQAAYELRLSHWTDGQAELVVNSGWAYRKYDQLFGQLVYAGQPVFGFRATSAGCRSIRTGATSTSTRSTRRTAPAGSARTASSRTPGRGRSATASTLTALAPRAPAGATGSA